MPPANEIVAVTPEQARLWGGFVRSNPSRVVHAVALGFHDRPNQWGDTLADFHPALAAVDEAAIEKDQRWQRLVDLGVADVLCINVLSTKMKNYLQDLPSGSRDTQNIPSSFFKPLTVLLHAALKFSDPPNGTDTKVITALKKHWSMMVIRLLREPENSLKPEEPYTFERATPAKLFSRILIADPSFTCVLDNEKDYTISLISRYWTYSTGGADIVNTTSTLSNFVCGTSDALHAYRDSRPFTPSTFIHVTRGANSIRNFISAMASHLNFYRGIDGFVEVTLLGTLWHIAVQGTHPIYSELLTAHRESLPLWTSIFSLLRRTVNDEKRPLYKGGNEEHIGIVLPLTHHTTNTIIHCNSIGSSKECADLISCWVAADLFGTLDMIIPFCASKQLSFLDDFVGDLGHLFYGIEATLQRDQTLVPLLHSQFPRARSLRALIDLSRSTNNQASPTQDVVSNQPCWMLFHNIERACVSEGDCTRRDCDRKRTARCIACSKAGYCGVDCQKRDWPEHKRVCKLKIEQ